MSPSLGCPGPAPHSPPLSTPNPSTSHGAHVLKVLVDETIKWLLNTRGLVRPSTSSVLQELHQTMNKFRCLHTKTGSSEVEEIIATSSSWSTSGVKFHDLRRPPFLRQRVCVTEMPKLRDLHLKTWLSRRVIP